MAVIVIALTAIVAAIRYAVATNSPVLGPDYGHYLIAENWYRGNDRTGEGAFDPPFVPLLTVLLSPILGRVEALRVLGAISAAIILPAAAFLMAAFVPRFIAVLGAAAFALWEGFTDFITFGGVTNLFGIAFSLIFFRTFFDALERPHTGLHPRRIDILAAIAAFLVVTAHHLTAFVTGFTVLMWIGLRLATESDSRGAIGWTTFRVGILTVALSGVYAPYLLEITTTDIAGGLGTPFPSTGLVTLATIGWRYSAPLWLTFLVLGMLVLLRFDRRSTLAPFALALLATPVLLVLTVLSSHPLRGLYYEQFPLVFLASLWGVPEGSAHLPRRLPHPLPRAFRTISVALLMISVPYLVSGVPEVQRIGMANSHQFMSAETLEAFEWIRLRSPTDAVFAVDGAVAPQWNELWKGMALGWWLEGYANRRAVFEAHPVLLPFQSKWDEARDANRLFAGDTVFEDGLLRVADDFPNHDAASPMVYSAFLQDYHETIGLAQPRVVNIDSGSSYPLILAANLSARISTDGDRGSISGNYAGPGFLGTRTTTFDPLNRTVRFEIVLTFDPSGSWDAVELTVRPSPRAIVHLDSLANGSLTFDIPTFPGTPDEHGSIVLSTGNLTAAEPTAVPQGIGLRWVRTGAAIALRADMRFSQLLSRTPADSTVHIRTSSSILDERDVDYLFVPTDSPWNLQRFDRNSRQFSRVFYNPAAVIYGVRGANG